MKAEIIRLADGRKLSYTVFGAQNPKPHRTIIYFHGFMSSRLEASMLHDRALELGIRCISTDRSGYGESTYDPHRTPHSSVKDIEELLEALLPHDEKVVFYGVSGKFLTFVHHRHQWWYLFNPQNVQVIHSNFSSK
jgi:pimeloyl-ACP methyl ester carboxylesterase